MSNLRKVRVQLLNETTGAVEEEVDVLTSAECVSFADGETFQDKLNLGKLTGAQGPKGDTGAKGTTGATGATGSKGDAGSQGPKGNTGTSIRNKGAWSSTTAYVCDANYIDLVTSGGITYICKASNTNQAVTNATYWDIAAQKGATGAQGAKGDTGAIGPQGAKGATGDRGATGAQGAKGDPGDTVKVGTSLSNAAQKKLFFKIV
ncbi:MAG: collagen-like protein [Clostridium sp.]